MMNSRVTNSILILMVALALCAGCRTPSGPAVSGQYHLVKDEAYVDPDMARSMAEEDIVRLRADIQREANGCESAKFVFNKQTVGTFWNGRMVCPPEKYDVVQAAGKPVGIIVGQIMFGIIDSNTISVNGLVYRKKR